MDWINKAKLWWINKLSDSILFLEETESVAMGLSIAPRAIQRISFHISGNIAENVFKGTQLISQDDLHTTLNRPYRPKNYNELRKIKKNYTETRSQVFLSGVEKILKNAIHFSLEHEEEKCL